VRGTIPHPRVVLTVLVVIAALVAAGYAWTYVPPQASTRDAVRKAVVGFELASVPIWPSTYRGSATLPPQARSDVMTAYRHRLAEFSTGTAYSSWSSMDFVRSMLSDRRRSHGLIFTAAKGAIVYDQFRTRRLDGRLVVRMAVQHWFTEGRWDADAGAMGPEHTVAQPMAVITDYTLQEVDGAWKVAAVHGWRFLDTRTGTITYDPPGSSPAPVTP
jgi:hypothetical protein